MGVRQMSQTENGRTYPVMFGSNEGGYHGAGAALHALQKHGAVYGQCCGAQFKEGWLEGQGRVDLSYYSPGQRSFAIPTKDRRMRTLSLDSIAKSVFQFLHHAHSLPDTPFYVTAIGTGLAGYAHADIAPMFKDAPPNCILPEEWIPWTRPNQEEAR